MIAWLSYTTSKVLPTFVGEIISTFSGSESSSRLGPGTVGRETESNSYYRVVKGTYSPVLTSLATTYWAEAVFGTRTTIGGGAEYRTQLYTSVDRNSTTYSSYEDSTVSTSPLLTIRQQTTATESYEDYVRQTTTIPQLDYFWTVGITDNITNFFQDTKEIEKTVATYVITEKTRTIIIEGEEVELLTYTALDGNVEVIAHTIYEALNAATFDSPTSNKPVTELSYLPTRFTHSFKELYIKTINVRDESLSTKSVTTTSTIISGHETTTSTWVEETFLSYYGSYETRSCSNRTGFTVYEEIDDEGNSYQYTVSDNVTRTTPVSYQMGFFTTTTSDTVVDTTTTTTETYYGESETTLYDRFGWWTGRYGAGGPKEIRTRTYYVENTESIETSTFFTTGGLLTVSSQDWPGLVDQDVFPWSTTGSGNKRFFHLPNDKTSFITNTSSNVDFEHTWFISTQRTSTHKVDRITFTYSQDEEKGEVKVPFPEKQDGATTFEWGNKKIGSFFSKLGYSTSKINGAEIVRFAHQNFQGHGLANPSLDFITDNTHSTLGAFMSDNAQHTWGREIERGNIMPGVVGAVPLYPKFSGLIYKDLEGWELCDTAEYTTVNGSRIGESFTTTIVYKTVTGTITQNTTSSGSFTINSFVEARVGAEVVAGSIRGGFFTPNASNTIIVSAGAIILLTTYDGQSSGTGSTQYPTGTTYTDDLNGEVPITISSYIPIVQGYGVFTQSLLDDGMP